MDDDEFWFILGIIVLAISLFVIFFILKSIDLSTILNFNLPKPWR